MTTQQAIQPLIRQVESLRLRGELRPPEQKLKDLHQELRWLDTQIEDLAVLYSDLRLAKARIEREKDLVTREIMLLERDGKAFGATH